MHNLNKLVTGTSVGCGMISILVGLFCVIGEILCVVKAVNSDWDPIGKREIIYTAAFFTGVGSIVGWFDIPDSPVKQEPTKN